jgi:hypothetical protein
MTPLGIGAELGFDLRPCQRILERAARMLANDWSNVPSAISISTVQLLPLIAGSGRTSIKFHRRAPQLQECHNVPARTASASARGRAGWRRRRNAPK